MFEIFSWYQSAKNDDRFWPTADLFSAPTFIFLTEQLEFNRKTANDPKRTFTKRVPKGWKYCPLHEGLPEQC